MENVPVTVAGAKYNFNRRRNMSSIDDPGPRECCAGDFSDVSAIAVC